MSLQFSQQPGCWERHLHRKYQNPLFPPEQQQVTQQEINAAQQRDQEERMDFGQRFHDLLEEVSKLTGQVESHIIFDFKGRIDRMYEECAALGGDFNEVKTGLKNLNQLIMQAIMGSSGQDPKARATLEEEQTARELHMQLLDHPLIADLLRPESPVVRDDLLPTLLNEAEPGLRAAMSLFDSEHKQILCGEARKLLERHKAEGRELPEAWEKLALMESLHD